MKQITIDVDDRVGVLADISYVLGKARLNIESLVVASLSGKAIMSFMVKDEKRAKQVLAANGYRVLESEVMVVRLKDRPGELSALSELLRRNGISILNLYIIAKERGEALLALRTDKTKKARRLPRSPSMTRTAIRSRCATSRARTSSSFARKRTPRTSKACGRRPASSRRAAG